MGYTSVQLALKAFLDRGTRASRERENNNRPHVKLPKADGSILFLQLPEILENFPNKKKLGGKNPGFGARPPGNEV